MEQLDSKEFCPICQRELIGTKFVDEHHLVPKAFKGKDKIRLHKVCHNKIHSVWTERELKNHFHTVERIVEHEEIQKFIKYVSKKDPEFYEHNIATKRKR